MANKLYEAIKKLQNKIEIELSEVPEADLNYFPKTEDDEAEHYDRTLRFRKEVINEGYYIIKMIAVYYQGWECDQWACIATKDSQIYKVSTNHGGLESEIHIPKSN